MARCFECRVTGETHDHHVVPRSRGGTRTVPLCLACHAKAHHRGKAMASGRLTSSALQAKKARGERVGTVPFGYRSEKGVLVPYATERRAARAAVEARDRGLSTRRIAAELTGRGWRSRTGGAISHTAVQRMLNFARRHDLEATQGEDGVE